VTPRKKKVVVFDFCENVSENQFFFFSKISIFAHFSLQQRYFFIKTFSTIIMLIMSRLHRHVAVILGSFDKTTKNDALRFSII